MANLFELTEEFKQLEQMFDEETDEETLQAILDTFESKDMEIEVKADGYAKIIDDFEGEIAKLDKAIKDWTYRKKVYQNKISSLKQRLEEGMRKTGKLKFKTDFHSFGIQKNGGKRKLTLNCRPEDLPEQFQIIEYKPNNDAIRENIHDTGEEENNYWTLEEQSESLRIRRK